MNVKDFLENRKISYEMLEHAPTYTAQKLAQAVHVPGAEVAKTVLCRADDEYYLAVLPATHHIDLMRLQEFLGANLVDLASEEDCGKYFPDCELGALPPFGSKYGMRTLVDRSLLEDEYIVFEGNTHHDAVRMKCDDFVAVEDPIITDFANRD